jgi:D-apiose dehydrogenase
MTEQKLRGALIGAGYFARFQAEAWRRMPDIELVAVADPRREHAQEFAAEYGIPRVYAEAEELLRREKPDFVDVATRPDSHLSLVELAASYQTPIICQKPMAATWEECVAMVERCRAANVRLLMHENWRWQAWYREIARLIATGIFGRIYHLGFCLRSGDGRGEFPYTVQPYFREMPHLLIYETLVHFIDTFRFLAGEIEWIFCQTKRINPHIVGEDYTLLQMSFASGAHGLVDANRISGPFPTEVAFGVFTLEGDEAALRMTPQGDLFITKYGQPEIKHDYAKPEIGYKGDSVFAAQRHYADCLRQGTPCESEGEDYLKTVKAVFASYESAATGKPVRLH